MINFSKKVIAFGGRIRRDTYSFLQRNRFAVVLEVIVLIFALVGLLFFGVFVGMRFHVFNVKGAIDDRNAFFTNAKPDALISEIQNGVSQCLASVRSKVFPNTDFAWIQSSEWQTLSSALQKDQPTIERAAHDAGISSRVLVSVVIAEQMRFFTSDRESFKKFFEPLKILGSLSQFSLGVSDIKPDTAKQIEAHLRDPQSPYYISKDYEHVLDATSSTDDERFARLTDSHDHYYSYLYTAMFIREVEEQWKRARYDVSSRPEILATIFNLGFGRSNPNPNPLVAGSLITVGGETYTFGRLAYEFYYSGELASVFPY